MRVIQDNLWLCQDCMIAACNGDVTGVESDERVDAIGRGLDALGSHLVPAFDVDSGKGILEFTSRGCDCCQSGLAGSLWEFAKLG